MKYVFQNKIFNTLEEAKDYANPIITEFQAHEAYRFSIAKEIVSGNDTTWMSADLENDPEDSVYFVFNTINGLHEKVNSKTEAAAKLEQVKQEFLVFSGMDIREITDEEALAKMEILLESATHVL